MKDKDDNDNESPGKKDRERKPSMNLTLDDDVIEALKRDFPREGSKIISGLSREFIRSVKQQPELLYYIKRDEIGLHIKKKGKS